MRWIVSILLVPLGLALLAAAIGALLPAAHTATREARVSAPPEAVWSLITNVEAFPSWRKDVHRVGRLPARDGRETWVEETSSGRITFVVERIDAGRLLVVRIADPDLPFGGSWTYELVPDRGGTLVRITENGEVYHPIFRFVARYVFGHDATMNAYLESLKVRTSTGEQSRGV